MYRAFPAFLVYCNFSTGPAVLTLRFSHVSVYVFYSVYILGHLYSGALCNSSNINRYFSCYYYYCGRLG
jgi:hypothetical protein